MLVSEISVADCDAQLLLRYQALEQKDRGGEQGGSITIELSWPRNTTCSPRAASAQETPANWEPRRLTRSRLSAEQDGRSGELGPLPSQASTAEPRPKVRASPSLLGMGQLCLTLCMPTPGHLVQCHRVAMAQSMAAGGRQTQVQILALPHGVTLD